MQVNEDKGYQQLMGLKMKAPSALVYIGGGGGGGAGGFPICLSYSCTDAATVASDLTFGIAQRALMIGKGNKPKRNNCCIALYKRCTNAERCRMCRV